jgi:molybdopterin synthase catalytic subunit
MASTTEQALQPPAEGDWLNVTTAELPVQRAMEWVTVPHCGAVVAFCGTVRDFSAGRSGVTTLHYEAYPEQVVPRLALVAQATRAKWTELGRLALLHRVGALTVGEVAVVVAVSTPHRAEAFAAAQFGIDTLKVTVPIWKLETWDGGSDWSVCTHDAATS